jgi:hypothetical protein
VLAQEPLPDVRRLVNATIKEAPWQKTVEQALTKHGWWWFHVPPNVVICNVCGNRIYRRIRKGIPDLIAVRPPYVAWLELKTERGTLKAEQKEILGLLERCPGQIVLRARPRDRERVIELITQPELWTPEA